MRIGVNALYLIPGGVGGTEIYLRSLLGALAKIDTSNEYLVFTNIETGVDLIPTQANFAVVDQRVRARLRPARILWEQMVLPVSAARRRVEVLFNPGFTSPILASCPTVTVFHDLQHKRYPEHFRWFDLPFWRLLLYGSVRRSSLLIADSESTRADLLRFYRVDDSKVRLAPLGVDPEFFEIGRRRHRDRQGAPYLLCVSTLHPHKNLDRLLRAFADFHAVRPHFRLVIAGLRGFYARDLEQLRNSLHLKDAVSFTGWIPRQQLYKLFADATAFLYPSTFEGFGMPLLEALAAGLPTACSNIEPLARNAVDAALKFDPNNTSAIYDAMLRITEDAPLIDRLRQEGPIRAAEFSWEATARATLEALAAAAERR